MAHPPARRHAVNDIPTVVEDGKDKEGKEEGAKPSSGFVCDGTSGILKDDICCETSCGTCGGSGCSDRDGGKSGCCTGTIREAGEACSESDGAPCIVGLETYTFIGCFTDKIEPDRIKIKLITSKAMTLEVCQAHCVGSIYFGVQYGIECWCDTAKGVVDYPFDIHGASDECNMECSGEATQTCGGEFAMSVFENL